MPESAMTETYRIHFGYSKKSKYYPQAIELARLAYKHEVFGEGDDTWHVVTLTDDQVDLIASLYVIAAKLPGPKTTLKLILSTVSEFLILICIY